MTNDLGEISGQILSYIFMLPEKALSGDLFALMVLLIILYSLAVIIKKSTKYMVSILKKLFLLIIIFIALYIFMQDFLFKVLTFGFTPDIIIIGITGLFCGVFAFIISIYAILKAVHKRRDEKNKSENPLLQQGTYAIPSRPEIQPQTNQVSYIPEQISNFAKDNSTGMVIIYLIVAEFGIFSSKTIAAASADTGFAVFLIFMFAALVFIKLTYNNYMTGLKHFALAFVLGFGLSILLGYFWGGIPLETLLSKEYFATDALVALITGLSLSLFMGGKGK